MVWVEYVRPVVVEVLATIGTMFLGAVVAFFFRLWMLPNLQKETIKELKLLREAVEKLTRQWERRPRLNGGDNGN